MADNSATAVYRGEGLTTSGWRYRGAATEDQVDREDNDMNCDQDDGAVRLEGRDGEAHGRNNGTPVPNLAVEHRSRPARTSGLPGNLQANPLTAGRGLHRGRRG
jgi:hypothetical protein